MQNAKMSEFTERDDAVYGGLWKIRDEGDKEKGYKKIAGTVDHNLGTVVFNQYRSWPTEHSGSSPKEWRNLRLSIIHEGREYKRTWDAWYGEKTIVRLANEFIEEIKGQEDG